MFLVTTPPTPPHIHVPMRALRVSPGVALHTIAVGMYGNAGSNGGIDGCAFESAMHRDYQKKFLILICNSTELWVVFKS